MRTAFLVGALTLSLTTPAFAEQAHSIVNWETGSRLYSDCTLPPNESFCFGYIEAVADTLGGGQPIFGGYRACIPPGVVGFRLREIVIDYLERIPSSSRELAASLLVTVALSEKFPCHK
ncbi:MAG: Rap1a/Tai family immunity protein [Stellaceae bacterium]